MKGLRDRLLRQDATHRNREKEEERKAHDQTYGRLAAHQLAIRTPEDYVREIATPAFEDNGVLAGDVNCVFISRVNALVDQLDPTTSTVLDYGCGMGKLSVYLAQKGLRHVEGFDLSERGVDFGNRLAELNDVADRVRLRQMDAEHLDYPDNTFDLVIGKAVLHHTIKYPQTAAELYRVLRPGGVAIFKEGIGNNVFLKMGRFVTMDLLGRHGDVNITTAMFHEFARPFNEAEIDAWSCFYMAKRFLWRPGVQPRWRKAVLLALKRLDDATVHRWERARLALCGEAIFTLRK